MARVERRRFMTRLAHVGKGLSPLLLILPALCGCPGGGPVLSISPSAVSFDSTHMQATVAFSNAGGGVVDWSVKSKPAWITLTPAQGQIGAEGAMVLMQADFAGLAAGNQTGEVVISSTGGTRGIAVGATVVAPPTLEATPSVLDFGGSGVTDVFTIRNTGGGTLSWSIQPPLEPWVTVNPMSGTLTSGGTAAVSVTVDRTGLSAGTQVGPVLIQLDSNGGSLIVTVQLTVQAFLVTPLQLDFGAQIDQLPLLLQNHGTGDLNWTLNASTIPNWITLDTGGLLSGTLAEDAEQTLLLNVDRAAVPPGAVTGELQFSSDGGDATVRLRAQGPEPMLLVTPLSLNFGSTLATLPLTVQNTGTGNLIWTIETGAETQGAFTPGDVAWLSATPASGQTPANSSEDVTVAVDRSKVTPNPNLPNSAALRVSSSDGQQIIVSVTMVALPPTIRVLPTNLAFGTTYARRILAIWNSGQGTVNWRIDTAGKPPWATLQPVDAEGIASGAVSGDVTQAVTVTVDRTGYAPAEQDYTWVFQVTGQDGVGTTLAPQTVTVTMNIARTPTINIDTGTNADGQPNVDEEGVPFVPFGTVLNTSDFVIRNLGTATLTWTINAAALPTWVKSVDPAQGAVAPQQQVTVTVKVDRTGLAFGPKSHTLSIVSDDPTNGQQPVRLEMDVPRLVSIGVRPSEISMGLYAVSASFEVANTGDSDSVLNFQVTSNKPWLFAYPLQGRSIGTASLLKDWQSIDISVDRSHLDGSGATGELTVTAYETDELGRLVTLPDVKPMKVTVSVQAAALTFEAAKARTRIPSLVRFVLMMRDIAYDILPLPNDLLDEYVNGFTIFEKEVPLERSETNQFLTSGANLRTNVAILLDYSGSMEASAKRVSDASIAQAPDPLQALYERAISNLIDELPSSYNIALMEFHERSQSTRLVYELGGPAFTPDKALLQQRLRAISIRDHGATELLPAVEDAAMLLYEADASRLRFSFDDADVRALICVTDGRLTTPPGLTKETLDFLASLKVRFFPVGWGDGVLNEPLARISSGTGGHYYPTMLEKTGLVDDRGVPITLPQVSELLGWCTTLDPVTAPCDQSVARDLQSQVTFSYVTLTEDSPITVRLEGTFDNPNDDNGICLPDQGIISGTMSQTQFDFLSIAGDVRLGQISLRSEGISGGRARMIVRSEYVPRNVDAFEFQLSSPLAFGTPSLVGGILEGWTLTDLGAQRYRLTRPDGVPVLKYGTFGDLLFLDFTDAIPAGGATVGFEVTDPVYSIFDAQGKYFVYPDTLRVDAQGSFGPAFPTPEITVVSPPSDTLVLDFGAGASSGTLSIRNGGGHHTATGVWLNWKVRTTPPYVTVDADPENTLVSTTETQTFNVMLDRTISSGYYLDPLVLEFDMGSLSPSPFTVTVYIAALVTQPSLVLISDDFLPGTYTLDFATTDFTKEFFVGNAGQSTLTWRSNTGSFPAWLSLTPSFGGQSTLGVTVTVDRTKLPAGANAFDVVINSNGGSQTITVLATAP